MKTKEIITIIIGILVGTSLGLFLTLYWWGNAWWQIVIAIFAGAIVGCVITDYILFWRILLKSYKIAENMLAKLGEKNRGKNKKKKEKRATDKRKLIYAIHNWVLFLLVVAFLVFSVVLITPSASGRLAFCGVSIIYLGVIMILFNYPFSKQTVIKMVNYNFADKINAWSDLEQKHKDYAKSIYKLNSRLNEIISLSKFFKRLWLAKFWDMIYMFVAALMITINLVISIIGTVIFLAILPFVLLKNLLSENKFLFVFLGVSVGVIYGTMSHSYVLGLLASLLVILPATLLFFIHKELKAKETFPIRIMKFCWRKMNDFDPSKL